MGKRIVSVFRVCAFYSLLVWLYVIVFQYVNPNSVYWGLAWWLPIRMDYLAETAFIASFIFVSFSVLNQKR